MVAKKFSILVLAAAAIAGGCAGNQGDKSTSTGNLPMDLSPAPGGQVAAMAPTASYVPPDPQPVMADPAPVAAMPVIASAAQPASGGAYTVRKGDTLYRIAKARYGSGKDWRKIASANPGLTPQTLRVGQKLVIPQ